MANHKQNQITAFERRKEVREELKKLRDNKISEELFDNIMYVIKAKTPDTPHKI